MIVLLYMKIIKYQLEYCVKDFTFQDGCGSRKKIQEQESSGNEDFRGKTEKIQCICVMEMWGRGKVNYF